MGCASTHRGITVYIVDEPTAGQVINSYLGFELPNPKSTADSLMQAFIVTNGMEISVYSLYLPDAINVLFS